MAKTRARNQRIRDYIQLAKNVKCPDCNQVKDDMTFDHLPQYKKRFNLASACKHGFGAVKREVAKCEVVCRDCHDKREVIRHQPTVMINKRYKRLLRQFDIHKKLKQKYFV